MSGAAILAAVSALAATAAVRELAADHGENVWEGLSRRLRRLPLRGAGELPGKGAFDLAGRIRRAGLDGSLGTGSVLAAKVAGATGGAGIWIVTASSLPVRLSLFLLCAWLGAGFLAPDLVLERVARGRTRLLLSELADGLDLIAVELGSGSTVPRALAAAAARGGGPLADELGRTVAAIESGGPSASVIAELGMAPRIPELSLAGRALARSHLLGAPPGDDLRAQASALRRERARAIREAADRAGPKIQLVVALVLVPAVLLIIAAALLAHAGPLFTGF